VNNRLDVAFCVALFISGSLQAAGENGPFRRELRQLDAIDPSSCELRVDKDRKWVKAGERGPYRIEHVFKDTYYGAILPRTDHAVIGVWIKAATGSMSSYGSSARRPSFSRYWKPMEWVQEDRRWVPHGAWKYRDEKEKALVDALFIEILKQSGADYDALESFHSYDNSIQDAQRRIDVAIGAEEEARTRQRAPKEPEPSRYRTSKDDYLSCFGKQTKTQAKKAARDDSYLESQIKSQRQSGVGEVPHVSR
jgi:hypothetical protein